MTSQAHALQQIALARDRFRSSIFVFERSDKPVAFTGLIEGEFLPLVKALTQSGEQAFKKMRDKYLKIYTVSRFLGRRLHS